MDARMAGQDAPSLAGFGASTASKRICSFVHDETVLAWYVKKYFSRWGKKVKMVLKKIVPG